MANTLKRPMKPYSKTPPLDQLSYPLYASIKLDGIRCYIEDGVAMSNANKPLPNLYLQAWAKKYARVLEGLDGELKVQQKDFNGVQSGIMTVEGKPDFTFNVFDIINDTVHPYSVRLSELKDIAKYTTVSRIKVVSQHHIESASMLQLFWDACVKAGHEGAIARSIEGLYKYGRSTLKEGLLIKLKVWHDAEAFIIGVKEKMHNGNKAVTNELGLKKRSSHKANKKGMNTLGSLVVKRIDGGVFSIGTGFSAKLRKELWALWKAGALIGDQCTYKFISQSKEGIPRHPVFKGLRSDNL